MNRSSGLATAFPATAGRLGIPGNGRRSAREPAARVVHAATPGRLRLAVTGLKRNEEMARRLQLAASGWGGVRKVSANPLTGSVLLEFSPEAVGVDQLVASVDALVNGMPPAAGPPRTGSSHRRHGGSSSVGLASVAARARIDWAGRNGSLDQLASITSQLPPPLPRRVRRLEATLGAAAVAGAAALLVAVRAHGHNLAFDRLPLELAAELHSPALTAFMRGVSGLVDPFVLVPVTAAATAAGVGRRSAQELPWLTPVAVVGGEALILGLKALLRRQRPTAFEHLMRAPGYSLPSGHAFLALCLYGLLAQHGVRWLRARRTDDRRAAALLVIMAASVVLLVGVSRVYLGVHYPTDVIAGYVLALVWLWLLAAVRASTPELCTEGAV